MIYRGRVKNGVIVLDPPGSLPEGAEVEVSAKEADNTSTIAGQEKSATTLYDRYKDFIGIIEALPADMAENHDHYIHGSLNRPK